MKIVDHIRAQQLRAKGYILLRFNHNDIKKSFTIIAKDLSLFINVLKGEYNGI
jgi:very-short-patch-repair endonuclease